ncbi:MAG TPA: hypothetical protein VF628_09635 [Allosphingosinicella sp.]|jgi:hypothetical protein
MLWLIVGGGIAVAGLLAWNARRPKNFSYRGRAYTRHGDGSFTYAGGGTIERDERQEVSDYWDGTHDSSSSDGGDGGGGDGGGGGD